MSKLFQILFLFIISAIIIIPRFFSLATLPPGLHIDEVSFAADAKSIAETGRDTWGQRYPLIFKAFGEWKAPGLVYSMAFWTLIIGEMNSFVARLPSALAGLTILIFLGLTLQLILPRKSSIPILLTVFVISFSPWHFDMSRIFYEAFSALALFAISLYFLSRVTLSKQYALKTWLLAAFFASLSGYWYASTRFIVLISFLIFTVIQYWSVKQKFQRGFLALLFILVVGSGWAIDLFSDKGLNRLYYYQEKAAYGASLDIDEKRQYCYLALDKQDDLAKWCYLLWNKPVEKITTALKTFYTYLGTDYLFVKAESEFGFDSQYGAFLFPVLPLYLVGLFIILSGLIKTLSSLLKTSQESTSHDRLYAGFALVVLVSLAPAALAGSINMRMAMITLYIISIVIGIGIYATSNYLTQQMSKIVSHTILLIYGLVITFYITQSLAHYFLIFTKSNDLQWTSDAPSIFEYVKSVSPQYDHIVDTQLHGPLAPYFYGDLTTDEVQSGEHSVPDAFGFTYLIQAGKYELRHINIKVLACEKMSKGDLRKTLVITEPVEDLSSARKFAGKSWNQTVIMREVYDLKDVMDHQSRTVSGFSTRCAPK